MSGLLCSPIFVNGSMIGACLGYYNPANGVTVNFTPTKSFYVNLGVYDGNRARGIQTGLSPPMFNGYYFNIGEIGVNWLLGEGNHPGQFGIGLWRQTGVLIRSAASRQDGTGGFYLFGSQRVAYRREPRRAELVGIRVLPVRREQLRRRCRSPSTTAPASPASA